MSGDPFTTLGLDSAASLTDDDVRVAWRRVAAATHPDRADGGDPQRFAIAAAAYTELRTGYGRGEARAGLERARHPPRPGPASSRLSLRSRLAARVAMRVIVAAAAATLGVLAARGGPAGPALATGAATWLAVTAQRDVGALAARRGQPGSGPVATGRAGSADQADHEPT
ncbi:MAG TPA: J domain-containing protein [Streptosporangiaceae bacterium]|nr:J domain-containing protein [Streptosporangiaceae bacterium]